MGNVLGDAIHSIREGFNRVAQSDTVQGAVLAGSVAFTLTGANPYAAAIGALGGAMVGAKRLRECFNAAVHPEANLQPIYATVTPQRGGPNGYGHR